MLSWCLKLSNQHVFELHQLNHFTEDKEASFYFYVSFEVSLSTWIWVMLNFACQKHHTLLATDKTSEKCNQIKTDSSFVLCTLAALLEFDRAPNYCFPTLNFTCHYIIFYGNMFQSFKRKQQNCLLRLNRAFINVFTFQWVLREWIWLPVKSKPDCLKLCAKVLF